MSPGDLSPAPNVLDRSSAHLCSSSNAMPRAVKAALHFCFMSAGAMSDEEAKQYMGVMEAEGRLAEECWS